MKKSSRLDPAKPEHNISRINEISLKSDSFNKIFEDGTPFFTRIEFSVTDLCNRVCEFCPRADPEVYPNNNEEISLELYEKIMKDLASYNWQGGIVFSAFGEPMLHRNLIGLIKLTKQYLPDSILDIVSNGDELKPEKCTALYEAGLDVLKVSLYDGPEQIEKFENMRKEIGIDKNRFILRHRYNKEENNGLIFSNRAGTIDLEGHKFKELPLKSNCYFTFYKLMIDFDGRVLLCSHDWNKKLSPGSLKDMSIYEVWTSPVLQNVRKMLSKENRNFFPCNKCDVSGTLNGKESFERWSSQLK
jgi:radical SAM protein with 4Fe4S-binding SPASM domain